MPKTSRSAADTMKRWAGRRARPKYNAQSSGYGAPFGGPQPPGGFSYGTNILGGPLATDAFGARRAPSPWQLIEKYKSLVFAMVARKRDGVAKIPIRLMADGSRKVMGGKPRAVCDPIKVSRSTAIGHARAGFVSPSAVDQVYEIRNHPFLDVLDNPDPYGYFSREKLIGLMVAYQDVVGSGYLVPEGNGWDWRAKDQGRKKGPPEYLWVLYSQYVIPFREAGSPMIRAWQYFMDYVPFEAAIWFRQSISLRDAYGSSYSPTYAGDVYADQEDRFMSIFDQVLGLGPRPSLIASAKDPTQPPGEAERKRFEQDMNRRHAAGNAGNLLVTNGAWEFTPVSYSPADLAGKEVSEYDRTNLACIFGLPPTYFTTESNLANLEAADAMFARFGIEPMCKSIAATLTRVVRQMDPRLYFQFDPVLADDELKRAQTDKIYVDMGAVTLNQLNEERKYPPVPWGDEPWLPGTLKQPSMLTEQHQQSMQQQQAAMDSQKARDAFELRDDGGGADEGDDTDMDMDAGEQRAADQDRRRWLLGQIERRLGA